LTPFRVAIILNGSPCSQYEECLCNSAPFSNFP
jgi:hypothetical protein